MKTRLALLLAGLLIGILLISPDHALSQTIYGTVLGTVFDGTGAVVPNVKVTVKNMDTGAVRETISNETGAYRVTALPGGSYTIEAAAPSFEKIIRGPVVIEAAVERTIDFILKPSSTSEVIQVTEQAPLIEAAVAQVSKGVEARRVLSLPGTNTLNGLALLTPGVSPNAQGRPGSGFVVNGGRTRSNNFMIDGANNNDQSLATPRQNLAPESLGEFRIITNGFSAEFGRQAGAIVQQVTRSGSNEFHGAARWSWAGNGLDALTTAQQRTFNAQKATGVSDYIALRRSRGVTVDNTFVGGAGGPIKKNHTFFFANYDRNWFRTTAVPITTALTQDAFALLRANNSAFAPGAVDFLANSYPAANDPTPRGSISVGLPDGRSLVLPLQQLSPGAVGYGTDFHRGLAKIDTRWGSKDSFSSRFLIDDSLDPGAPQAIVRNRVGTVSRNWSWTTNHIRTWSPALVSESRFTWSTRDINFPQNLPFAFSIGASGLPGLGNQNFPQFRNDGVYEINNTQSWVKGKHNMRFGGQYLLYKLNSFFAPTFDGAVTYPSMADFLFDRNATFNRYAGDAQVDEPTHELGFFFQDDYRVAKSLTLNLGIRYEYTSAPAGYYSNAKADVNNWAPRFGFAWAPKADSGILGWLTGSGKMSVRGGYAISYDQVFQNVLLNVGRNFPRGVNIAESNQTGRRLYNPANWTANLTPEIFVQRGGNPNLLPLRLFSPNRRIQQPYGQQFNLGVERQFRDNYALRVFYIGTRGVKLIREVEQNLGFFAAAVNNNPTLLRPIVAGMQPTTIGGAAAFRNDPTRGSILVGDGIAQSNFHSLQVTLVRRFSRGLQMDLNYTWSAFINDADDILGGQANRTVPSVPFNYRLDRGRSGFDVPHRFVGNWIYELPFMKAQNGILGRIVGGWQVSGVVTMQTGTPYGILNAFNALGILPGQIGTVELSQRASQNSAGVVNQGSSATVPNPEFIANPANSGVLFNLGANTERVGNTYNVNSALVKEVRTFGERQRLVFQWEVFNIFNHRNFTALPANTVSSATNNALFMNLGQTNVAGRGMQLLVRYIW